MPVGITRLEDFMWPAQQSEAHPFPRLLQALREPPVPCPLCVDDLPAIGLPHPPLHVQGEYGLREHTWGVMLQHTALLRTGKMADDDHEILERQPHLCFLELSMELVNVANLPLLARYLRAEIDDQRQSGEAGPVIRGTEGIMPSPYLLTPGWESDGTGKEVALLTRRGTRVPIKEGT